jgi:hypothetical protein
MMDEMLKPTKCDTCRNPNIPRGERRCTSCLHNTFYRIRRQSGFMDPTLNDNYSPMHDTSCHRLVRCAGCNDLVVARGIKNHYNARHAGAAIQFVEVVAAGEEMEKKHAKENQE